MIELIIKLIVLAGLLVWFTIMYNKTNRDIIKSYNEKEGEISDDELIEDYLCSIKVFNFLVQEIAEIFEKEWNKEGAVKYAFEFNCINKIFRCESLLSFKPFITKCIDKMQKQSNKEARNMLQMLILALSKPVEE